MQKIHKLYPLTNHCDLCFISGDYRSQRSDHEQGKTRDSSCKNREDWGLRLTSFFFYSGYVLQNAPSNIQYDNFLQFTVCLLCFHLSQQPQVSISWNAIEQLWLTEWATQDTSWINSWKRSWSHRRCIIPTGVYQPHTTRWGILLT